MTALPPKQSPGPARSLLAAYDAAPSVESAERTLAALLNFALDYMDDDDEAAAYAPAEPHEAAGVARAAEIGRRVCREAKARQEGPP